MIKHIIVLLIIITVFSNCSQKRAEKNLNESKDFTEASPQHDSAEFDIQAFRERDLKGSFDQSKIYSLTDTIKEDFTGDGVSDWAIFRRIGEQAGLTITDGKSGKATQFGFGKSIAHLDDFSWVDYWGTVKDSTTYEVLTEGDEVTGTATSALAHTSIFLFEDEVGGGLITYRNGTYEWIHQAD